MSESDDVSCEDSVEREPCSPRDTRDSFCQTDQLSTSSTSTTSDSPSAGSPDSGEPPHKLSWETKLEQARSFKSEGNNKYQNAAFKGAIGKYHRALLFIKGIEDAQHGMPFMPETEEYKQSTKMPAEAQKEVYDLKLACYNNLSACILQTDTPMYSKVVQYSDNVLQLSPNNTKALYRKAVALFHLKNIEKALQTLQLAKQQPQGATDSNIARYIILCEAELNRQEKQLKKTCENMFEKMLVADDDEEVFSTTDDPGVVKPTRKLQKARSTDTSPW